MMRLGRGRVGHRHGDGERRASADEANHLRPLSTQEFAVANRRGVEPHRVRAGTPRFGHGEARANAAGGQRAQPPFAVLGGAVGQQQPMLPTSGACTLQA